MTKAVLFDIDGVLLPKEQPFSEKLAQEYDIDPEEVKVFFNGAFKKCLVGEADLKQEIKPFLKAWNWEGNTSDFLDYWFFATPEADEDMMKLVDKLHSVGIECHLASNQEKYRAEYLLTEMRFADYFDESFFSCDLLTTKKDQLFFKRVVHILDLKPKEIFYFDDDPKNIEAALSIGINAHLFTDIDSARKVIVPLTSN